MKPIKLGLRIWIAITSIISFLGGWMLFSHAGKPVPLFSAQQAVDSQSTQPQTNNLPPIPSLDQLTKGNGSSAVQPLPSLPQGSFQPRFRTRGS
jgi:hypothetical protein